MCDVRDTLGMSDRNVAKSAECRKRLVKEVTVSSNAVMKFILNQRYFQLQCFTQITAHHVLFIFFFQALEKLVLFEIREELVPLIQDYHHQAKEGR